MARLPIQRQQEKSRKSSQNAKKCQLKTRLQICPLYIFGNNPPQTVPSWIQILLFSRVWRLDSWPNHAKPASKSFPKWPSPPAEVGRFSPQNGARFVGKPDGLKGYVFFPKKVPPSNDDFEIGLWIGI